jgi:hypothetical protein
VSEVCGATHPDRSDVTCDRRPHDMVGYHHDSAAGQFWDADPLPTAKHVGRAGLAAIAARTIRTGRTGPAADAVATWSATTKETE